MGGHDSGDHHGTGVRAPDLETATQRLRFAWFQRWLHNPQSIAPGTRMPNVFNAGMSVLPHVLDGRESTQVSAIWSYLKQRENRVLSSIASRRGRHHSHVRRINTPIPDCRTTPDSWFSAGTRWTPRRNTRVSIRTSFCMGYRKMSANSRLAGKVHASGGVGRERKGWCQCQRNEYSWNCRLAKRRSCIDRHNDWSRPDVFSQPPNSAV